MSALSNLLAFLRKFMGFDSRRFRAGVILILNVHGLSVRIETHSSRFENCCTLHGGMDRSKRSVVIVGRLRGFGIDTSAGIDKVFEGLHSVTGLSREHAIGRCVFHEERIHGCVTGAIGGNTRTSVSLVDRDFALRAHETARMIEEDGFHG